MLDRFHKLTLLPLTLLLVISCTEEMQVDAIQGESRSDLRQEQSNRFEQQGLGNSEADDPSSESEEKNEADGDEFESTENLDTAPEPDSETTETSEDSVDDSLTDEIEKQTQNLTPKLLLTDFTTESNAVFSYPTQEVSFVKNSTGIYKVKDGIATSMINIRDTGDEAILRIKGHPSEPMVFFSAEVTEGQSRLFGYHADQTTTLTASDALSNTSGGGNDQPETMTFDALGKQVFFRAKDSSEGWRIFKRSTSYPWSTTPVEESSALTAAGNMSGNTQDRLRISPDGKWLYFNGVRGCRFSACAEYALFRLATDASTPVEESEFLTDTIQGDYQNDYPTGLSFDSKNGLTYFNATLPKPANQQSSEKSIFVIREGFTNFPIIAADSLINIDKNLGISSCEIFFHDVEREVVFGRCKSSNGISLFRITPDTTSSNSVQILQNLTTWFDLKEETTLDFLGYDQEEGSLFFAATLRTGASGIYKVTPDTTPENRVSSNSRVSYTSTDFNDNPGEAVLDPQTGRMYFTARDENDERNLYVLTRFSNEFSQVTAENIQTETCLGCSDDPRDLRLDPRDGTLYFTASISVGTEADPPKRKVFALLLRQPAQVLAADALLDHNPGGNDEPEFLSEQIEFGALFFTVQDKTGNRSLFQLSP